MLKRLLAALLLCTAPVSVTAMILWDQRGEWADSVADLWFFVRYGVR